MAATKRFAFIALLCLALLAAGAEDRLDVTDEGHFLPGDPPVLVGDGQPFATWAAYHNGIRISEPDFYRILGEDELAAESETWLKWKKGLGWAGLVVIGGGLATGIATNLILGARAGDLPFYTSAAAITLGGGFWVGFLSIGFNFRPLDEARRMADDYNAKHG